MVRNVFLYLLVVLFATTMTTVYAAETPAGLQVGDKFLNITQGADSWWAIGNLGPESLLDHSEYRIIPVNNNGEILAIWMVNENHATQAIIPAGTVSLYACRDYGGMNNPADIYIYGQLDL